MSGRRVAVIGAGASGALQALHLRRAGAEVSLIERGPAPGRGVAYGTTRPEHLLNVPARRMSAFSDDPDHFTRWFEARGGGGPEDFAPRMLYGDYLVSLLSEAGIEAVRGEAVDLAGGAVRLADGRALAADAVVLAPGNFRPATPRGIDPAALGAAWIENPWAGGLEGLGARDVVLLVGTGLTAVDVALTLDATGFRGRIVALSRRGLAPRAHGPREPMVAPAEALPASCVALLRRVRARSGELGWRSAVHELRSVTQAIWGGAGPEERRRFLRHLRPWWDVHRHKVAPAVGERIEAMQAEARLAVAAGKLVSAEAIEEGAALRFRMRGGEAVETLRVARIVNCTGPECDIVRAGEPLLAALLKAGRIRQDALGIGIEVDPDCRAIGADGTASETLAVIGPVTRGTFWESVAVPDIRAQAERVAARLTG
ncbi:MAG TPA: FAD-dependent oxidoreductase [Allosphingosinicella sp.]|nr:FAD-dependent oxidoreductase [Allosphingosinicella sp.]